MGIEMRRQYLERIKERYNKSDKETKSRILNEFCAVCGYSRKYAVRILCGILYPKKARAGRPHLYGPEVALHVRHLWAKMDYICSKKMHAAIPVWLEYYSAPGLTDEMKELLKKISRSTLDRMLKPMRAQFNKGRSGTRTGTLLRNRIPIQDINWDNQKPGFIEADTVCHCGNSLAGDFINSLTMVDLFSDWTANRAVWTKDSAKVKERIQEVEKALPFRMKGFDCDCGGEFLNFDLVDYFEKEHSEPVKFTRSRPYQKNDNAHVEQKNYTHVRQLFGYQRFDDPALVDKMNEIYIDYWNPLQNFFIPTLKCKEKTRIGGRILKKYGPAKTPYQRLMDSTDMTSEEKLLLKARFETLNPFVLKENLEKKLKEFSEEVKKINFRKVA